MASGDGRDHDDGAGGPGRSGEPGAPGRSGEAGYKRSFGAPEDEQNKRRRSSDHGHGALAPSFPTAFVGGAAPTGPVPGPHYFGVPPGMPQVGVPFGMPQAGVPFGMPQAGVPFGMPMMGFMPVPFPTYHVGAAAGGGAAGGGADGGAAGGGADGGAAGGGADGAAAGGGGALGELPLDFSKPPPSGEIDPRVGIPQAMRYKIKGEKLNSRDFPRTMKDESELMEAVRLLVKAASEDAEGLVGRSPEAGTADFKTKEELATMLAKGVVVPDREAKTLYKVVGMFLAMMMIVVMKSRSRLTALFYTRMKDIFTRFISFRPIHDWVARLPSPDDHHQMILMVVLMTGIMYPFLALRSRPPLEFNLVEKIFFGVIKSFMLIPIPLGMIQRIIGRPVGASTNWDHPRIMRIINLLSQITTIFLTQEVNEKMPFLFKMNQSEIPLSEEQAIREYNIPLGIYKRNTAAMAVMSLHSLYLSVMTLPVGEISPLVLTNMTTLCRQCFLVKQSERFRKQHDPDLFTVKGAIEMFVRHCRNRRFFAALNRVENQKQLISSYRVYFTRCCSIEYPPTELPPELLAALTPPAAAPAAAAPAAPPAAEEAELEGNGGRRGGRRSRYARRDDN